MFEVRVRILLRRLGCNHRRHFQERALVDSTNAILERDDQRSTNDALKLASCLRGLSELTGNVRT